MSTLELDVGRDGAERLVEAALRRTEGVEGFTREGDTFVVTFAGRTASFGQRLAITFESEGDGPTAIEVKAHRTSPFAFTANPWRRKADFLEQLRRIRDDPRERARIERGEFADAAAEDAATAADAEPEPVDPADLQTLRAVKLLLAVVGTLTLLVLGAAWLL